MTLYDFLKDNIGLGYMIAFEQVGFNYNIQVTKVGYDGKIRLSESVLPMDDSHFNEERLVNAAKFTLERLQEEFKTHG